MRSELSVLMKIEKKDQVEEKTTLDLASKKENLNGKLKQKRW